ncbi:MAG: transglycosylase domain-containing protein, partial [Acidimicrobiales bacterium]
MRPLFRLVAIVSSIAIVISGAVVGVGAATAGVFSQATSAQAATLPPLGTTAELGSTIYASDGTTVLATLRGAELRQPVTFQQLPPVLIHAVLDTEDQRFYIHGGFDFPSTLRALASDSSASGGLQGGSTIAQQLVKQTYLTSARKLSRKVKEAVLASRLEQKYSKDRILEAYLNTIYLGNGAYGVQAAATVYFNESVSKLTLPQAAIIAGLIQDPSGYDPVRHPEAARSRRSEVLARMVHYGDITQPQADQANAAPLPTATTITAPSTSSDSISDYYVNEVRAELLGASSPLGSTYQERYQALYEGGLKIVSNLNVGMQAAAKASVARDTPRNSGGFQQALVSIEPGTGKVLAMVGGNGAATQQYNVITQGERQPGS